MGVAAAIKKYILSGETSAKAWHKATMPKRVLLIRLQAMGDMVITLPYIQCLRNMLPPSTKIDLLTRREVDEIPRHLRLFNDIYSIKGKRNLKRQFVYACLLLPRLVLKRYEVIIDLQDNLLSRLVLKTCAPEASSIFDKESPIPAGERTSKTIEAAGLGAITMNTKLTFKQPLNVDSLLYKSGWKEGYELLILNPAGAFETRNWHSDNYIAFTKLWLAKWPNTQVLIIGITSIADKAEYLQNHLGDSIINLVNKTTMAEAFAVIQKAKFTLSEDSGLMHMSWVLGVPTLAIFGSSRSDWTQPLGPHTSFLGSSDLPCGDCMLQVCKYANNHCLTRYTPEFVFTKALDLLASLPNIK